MAYNEDSSASCHDEPWIQWFCGLRGHEMFCEVERSYIEDGFNLYGLRAYVSNFSDCVDLILDRIGPDDSDDSHLTQSACTLYGLIHARYIITAHGLDTMYNKYAAKEFGTCPLIQCYGQPVLPLGLRDEMGFDSVKIFCPKCQCVYHPAPIRSRSNHSGSNGGGSVDGGAFGTTFPHLFLMTFNNLVPDSPSPDTAYVPRVFGFRVHSSARSRGTMGVASSTNPTTTVTNNGRKPPATTSTEQLQPAPTVMAGSSNGTNTGGLTSNNANGVSMDLCEVEAMDATATDSKGAARPQDLDSQEDKTAATSAAASIMNVPQPSFDDNDSQSQQSKNKGSGTSSKGSKLGSEGKKDDASTGSKRRGGTKNGAGGDNNNGDSGSLQSSSKRQKRPVA